MRCFFDAVLKLVLLLCALLCIFALLFTALEVIFLGGEAFSLRLLLSVPDYVSGAEGLLPQIINTVIICSASTAIAMPAGILCSTYLLIYAKSKTADKIKVLLGAAGTIPTAVYGLFGFFVFSQLMRLRYCVAAGILTLSITLFSVAASMSLAALLQVDEQAWRASYALGATDYEMVFTALFPCAKRGICSAAIICLAKAMGESAALLFTAGTGDALPADGLLQYLMSSGATLAVGIYQAVLEGKLSLAFAAALVLMLMIAGCDILSEKLVGGGKKDA